MANLVAIPRHSGWLSSLASFLPALTSRPRPDVLDIRTLSDHLKRDMGFLDGNEPGRRR